MATNWVQPGAHNWQEKTAPQGAEGLHFRKFIKDLEVMLLKLQTNPPENPLFRVKWSNLVRRLKLWLAHLYDMNRYLNFVLAEIYSALWGCQDDRLIQLNLEMSRCARMPDVVTNCPAP
jgi:hypothetical protein